MGVRVQRHDLIGDVVFYESQAFARSCIVSVNKRFLAVDGLHHCVVVRADDVGSDVLQECLFVLGQLLSLVLLLPQSRRGRDPGIFYDSLIVLFFFHFHF